MTGQDMKLIRKLLKMTQKQFGSDLGIPNPQVQIAMMETGHRTISKRLIRSIAMLVDNKHKDEALAKAGVVEAE